MQVTLLKSKILRAKVTDANIDYQGSLGIDSVWMDEVGLLPYEKILVGNLNSGDRFETYVIPCAADSGSINLNGAAARLGEVGDLLVIMSFAEVDASEAEGWEPKILILNRT
ncbi:MAG: aspartate 1-decarboxylase [Opitutae bacterium]|nr:aspartate 1-decarboxylase [Opitutae bacterium]MBT4223983.1 aspartate 1-decarboxylase [Opitutae bacterium]MBT5378269.1 aspartate 1-decarboxylase [Opitutae bacterium]MBT5691416.1 aspartate 1-decarboxylase [Opitutae bacterium]MBT6461472.1 aspartate 1-decarboxylase [Opitutae bacterium]